MVDESVDGKNHKPLQPLDELGLAGPDRVFLAHPPLHHLVELIASYGAHAHQERVSLGQREPASAYKHNTACENTGLGTRGASLFATGSTAACFKSKVQS